MFSGFRLVSLITMGLSVSSVLLFPQTSDSGSYTSINSLIDIEKNMDEIKKRQENTLSVWRHFQSLLMEEYSTINYDKVSEQEMDALIGKIKNVAMPLLKAVMTQGAKNLKDFSSYELYILSSIVDSSLKIVKKGSIAYKFMNHMKKKLDLCEKTPYEYVKGQALEKDVRKEIKVFGWNTCMLPGKLSEVFSGLEPWTQRVDKIIEVIGSQNADIICLQEVHSELAASRIYEAIKDRYTHFYMNMGPKPMGSNMSDVGLNSGLFVASKVSLENIHFEAFSTEEGQRLVNKGFFWADVKGTEVGFATCHLEPFNQEHSLRVRHQELQYVIKFVQSKNSQVRILAGDLNIPWGSNETAEQLIGTHFYDPYNKNRQDVTPYSRTFSDYFVSKKGNGSSDILDYFLILQIPGFEKYAFITERVEGFDEIKLSSKGSDHHGLYSHIIFPENQK